MSITATTTTRRRTRLAPTPSGFLHRGNLLNFYMIWQLAKREKMEVLLRIDDIDRTRMRPVFVEDIFRVLEHMGIEWDEGPQSVDDFERHWSQHLRMPLYRDFLQRLQKSNAVYACECTRKSIGDGPYRGLCRHKKLSLNDHPWRANLSLLQATDSQILEDPIIWRRERLPAYHIASVVDDMHFAITDIVRGEDLRTSTLTQIALARLAQSPLFLQTRFYHHPLITNEQGEKLSKSRSVLEGQEVDPGRLEEMQSLREQAARMLDQLVAESYL